MQVRYVLTGLALAGSVFAAQAATDYPSGFTKCAQNTGATCTFSGTRQVALGKSGSFVYATFTNGAICAGSNFPSNSFSSSAWCSYAAAVSSSSSSSSKSSSSAVASSVRSSVASSVASSRASSSAISSSRASSSTAGSSSSSSAGSCPLVMEGFSTLNGGTTGGGNAAPTTVSTVDALKACVTDTAARVCRVQGTITFDPFQELAVKSNKTIIGVGTTGHIVNGGFNVSYASNVIIRNLTIRDSFIEGDWEGKVADNDGVQMDTSRNIWIDHNRFTHLADGLIDSRKDTTNLTVSWNVMDNHNKAFGIGWTDNVTAEITIHHNWFNGTNQRNPSADNILRAHLYNNLLENIGSYGNYARGATNMVLENSVFVNVANPHYYDTGTLVASGNIYQNTSGRRTSTGSSYSFFNPKNHYPYVLHSASQVSELVKRCAGPRPELGQ